MKIQIIDGNVLLPTGLKKVSIELENGLITRIGNRIKEDPLAVKISAAGKYVLPGFIDLHTNGIAGFDLTNGLFNLEKSTFISQEDDYLKGLDNALKQFSKQGTTLVGFTTLEAPINKMKRIFQLIAKYKNESPSIYKELFHGIYLEGTFMKDKRFRGAHNPKYFFKPSIQLFKELQEAANGNIKIVNVVPEWGDAALELIEYLATKNIVCAAGHTSATGNQYRAAISKGLTLAIHVLNGPSSSSYKPFDGGGSLESFLQSDDMFVEIITDGYHVDKSYVLDLIKKKGTEKCVAITDSMFVTKMKKVKEFQISGVKGKVSENGEYIQIAGRENDNALFGSVLTMDKAFENLLNWFTSSVKSVWSDNHESLSLNDAIVNASKMCSANPAKILGIYFLQNGEVKKEDNNITGSIELHKSGDIVIADISEHNKKYKIKIEKTLVKGNLID
ncbi:MAG: amidohydrolase family protein [Bacteroidetes bacterium]|nr:amidohydrolase family protein [Bacteroidota bacterium]MBU1116513.1 amidohydrolase family protein [Bacteroidota bacterium]MBU1798770.1 amidohydrolase family protein [Bacteroidota bacterium]